jgi:hypothetical protein
MSDTRILKVKYRVKYKDDKEFLSSKFRAIVLDHLAYIVQQGPAVGGQGKVVTSNGSFKWKVEDG